MIKKEKGFLALLGGKRRELGVDFVPEMSLFDQNDYKLCNIV